MHFITFSIILENKQFHINFENARKCRQSEVGQFFIKKRIFKIPIFFLMQYNKYGVEK